MSRKKAIVMVMLGAFIVAGLFVPYVSYAFQHEGRPMGHEPGMMAQKMAEDFGLNKNDVEKYCKQGVNPRELMHAAMLSKASGKSLNEVLAMKTLANTWQDVEKKLGVSKEKIHTMMQDMMAANMEKNFNISKQNTLDLMKKGYHPRDIVMAGVLAQDSKKQISDVLAMKKINNNWQDVAKQLGISDSTFKEDMKKIHDAMPGKMHRPDCGPENGEGHHPVE